MSGARGGARERPRRGPGRGIVAALLGSAGALGCGDGAAFRVVEVRPAPQEGPLRRNEEITVLLDREVDPTSVSSHAVRVRLPDGSSAAGRLEVEGRRVTFVPRPGRTPTYDDGGYGAADRVTLELEGFPARGLLAAGGRVPLGATTRREFALAPLPEGRPSARSFRDPSPGGPRLSPPAGDAGELTVAPGGVLSLHFSEPLFPPIQEPVRLRFDDRDRTSIPTSIELIQGEQGASLRVSPVAGFREGTRYLLELVPAGIVDLVGHPFEGGGLPGEYRVRVVAASEGGS